MTSSIPHGKAGHTELSIHWERDELQKAVVLLRAVAERYAASRGTALPPARGAPPAGPTTPTAGPPTSLAPGPPQRAAPLAPTPPFSQTPFSQPPLAPTHPFTPAPLPHAPPPFPVSAPTQPPPLYPPFSGAPPSAMPASLVSNPAAYGQAMPPVSAPTYPPPQPAMPPPPPPRSAAMPPPQPATVPTVSPSAAAPVNTPGPCPVPAPRPPKWEAVWTTDPEDHAGDPVHALAYCPTISGLPGGDGHGGWLISSSRHTLNLWEATPGGGAKSGEPSIMMMHSQLTDFLSTHLAVEESLSTMFAVSLDTKAGSECVSVHSLSADTGILPYKYRIVPPADTVPGQAQVPKQRGLHRVASLHPLGRYLRNHIVAAHGPRILMYEIPAGGTSAPAHATVGLKPKRTWKALEGGPQAAVTALHANALSGGLLFTGATDGSVAIWNLTERPGYKIRDLKCDKHVSALQLVSDTTLVTSSMDGKVLLWDMRKPAQPFRTAIPDGSPALQLDVSPASDCMAVATAKGVYSVSLLDGGGTVTPISPNPLSRPPLALSWNWSTNEVYVAGHNGTITVYRQSARG